VAVVGGGVSGLSAAWHLHTNGGDGEFDVHLFEKDAKVGGHAHSTTIHTVASKPVDVDIGFMVFNEGPTGNYPNMTSWFGSLGVRSEDSDMSLSVSLDGGDTVEWSSDGLSGLFAKRSQALSPKFYQMVREMIRFNAGSVELLRLDPADPRRRVSTGQYLRDHGYSEAFAAYYLLPMMAALWSASIEDVLAFPAEQLIGFLCNHKMLQLFDRPQVCRLLLKRAETLFVHFFLFYFVHPSSTNISSLPSPHSFVHNIPTAVEDGIWSLTDLHLQGRRDSWIGPGSYIIRDRIHGEDTLHQQVGWT